MLTWGAIASAMMFVQTPGQFYAMRLLLGAAEAGFFPGVIFYLTQWFPKEYRGRTISRFYFSGPLGAALMGALAGPFLNLQGRLGLAGWQWLFLLQGLPAILLGLIMLAALPDQPAHASWLSVAERSWLESHLEAERAWLRTTQAVFWLIPSDLMRGRSAALGLAAIGSIGMLGAFGGPYGWGVANNLTGGYQVGLIALAVAYASAFTLLMSLRGSSLAAAPVTSTT